MAEIAGFAGRVLEPSDDGYDDSRRIWNAAIDKRPALVGRCSGTADVIAAVRYARERDLLVAVRGGGHQVSGNALCNDGLVIDLSRMRAVLVDPVARTATVQGGALWGDVDHETQAFGLAVTGGVVTHTGVAGLTLGGGIGWLMRQQGLTVDNLLSVDLVTADGESLHASAEEHPDLFWAARGGGGNFGIVTSFEFALHPVGPAVLAGPIFWPMEDAPELIRFYRDFIETVPDEFMSVLNLRHAPPLAAIPSHLHGRRVCAVAVCWCGPIDQGQDVVAPLRAFGSPLLDLLTPKPYIAHQSMFDPVVPHGLCWHWKSCVLDVLKDDLIDGIVDNAQRITSPLSYTVIFQLGGAVSRVDEEATAYSHRGAAHNININAGWRPDDDNSTEHVAWSRTFYADLERHQVGVYMNFLGDEGQDRVRVAYGEEKYQRLVALKDRYDPDNFFRINQNIAPTSGAAAG